MFLVRKGKMRGLARKLFLNERCHEERLAALKKKHDGEFKVVLQNTSRRLCSGVLEMRFRSISQGHLDLHFGRN